MKNKNLAKRWFYTPKDGFLSHLGHFSPFVFWPHLWQRCSNLTAEVDGVLDNFTIKAIIIKTPTTIPIQTRTISITYQWSLIIYSKKYHELRKFCIFSAMFVNPISFVVFCNFFSWFDFSTTRNTGSCEFCFHEFFIIEYDKNSKNDWTLTNG